MKILVTGSYGFVGRRLVTALKKKGHSVKEFDLGLGNDVLKKNQCLEACKGIDAVYHLAAVLDEKAENLFEVNVNGTENILEAAAKQRCSQFVFLSSVGVNAGCKGIVDENSALKPRTGYEKSKAEAEKLVWDAQEILPITIIRSALVLGPNKYWEQIAKLVRKGFPLIGGGKQAWQTIYVDDLVDALVFILGKEACLGERLLVAEKEKHSLRELYAAIQAELSINANIRTVPTWLAKVMALFLRLRGKKSVVTGQHIDRLARERNYDTGKIEGLGWKAKVGMKEAVKRTVAGLKTKK
jgi:UDP-glucose 4-epimerase